MRPASRLAVALFLVAAACGDDTTKGNPDLAPPDQAMPDVAMPQDFAMPDQTMPIDAAMDMAMPDLWRPADAPIQDLAMPDLVPPPDLIIVDGGPPPTVISHFRWTNFCEAFTACGFFGAGVTMSFCIAIEPRLGALPFAPASTLTCIAGAGNSCAAIKVCLNNGDANTVTCDSSQGTNQMCTGAVYSYCLPGQNFHFAEDCTKLGLTCVPGGTNTGCGFGTCPQNINQNYCVAGFTVNCIPGGQGVLKALEDCRVFDNETCTPTSDADAGTTMAACTGLGAACTADTCNGNTLVACKNGHTATYDCTKRGEQCVTLKGKPSPTCGLGSDCDPGTFSDTCNGNVLTFCDAGKISTLNCVTDGWKSCTAGACAAQ